MNSIQKNIELGESFLLRKWYKKHIWKIARAYNLALAYLSIEDKNVFEKNLLWVRFFISPESIDSKKYFRLQQVMSEHAYIINQALEDMNKVSQKDIYSENQIFKHTNTIAPIGVYAYELPE